MPGLNDHLKAFFEVGLSPIFAVFDYIINHLTLPTLSLLLGLCVCLPLIYGLVKPKEFTVHARKFARSVRVGWVFTILATFWFLYYVKIESVSDFALFKHWIMLFFLLVGFGTCFFVQDYLAVRGLAVLMLLCAKLMVDSARWADTPWRLVITTWAYILVIAGMWWTISPYRLRDLINWATANEQRVRWVSGMAVAFGVFILVLGATVFRVAERRSEPATTAHAPAVIQSVTTQTQLGLVGRGVPPSRVVLGVNSAHRDGSPYRQKTAAHRDGWPYPETV